MVLWNKVSMVSPYLDGVRSSIGEGPVRVWCARSVDPLQILAIYVLIRESSWLTFDGQSRPLLLVRSTARSDIFKTLI